MIAVFRCSRVPNTTEPNNCAEKGATQNSNKEARAIIEEHLIGRKIRGWQLQNAY